MEGGKPDTTALNFLHSWGYCFYVTGLIAWAGTIAYVISTIDEARCLAADDSPGENALQRCVWVWGRGIGGAASLVSHVLSVSFFQSRSFTRLALFPFQCCCNI